MIKRFMFVFLGIIAWNFGITQTTQRIESLKHELAVAKKDTSRVLIMLKLCSEYDLTNLDSGIWTTGIDFNTTYSIFKRESEGFT